jgi:hypothetical protein
MLIFWAIIAGVAAILAVVVSSLIIGTCLAVAWIIDAVRGSSQRQQPAGGRRAGYDAPHAGSGRGSGPGYGGSGRGYEGSGRGNGPGYGGSGRGNGPGYEGSGRRDGPGVPAAYRRGDR